MKIIVVGCGKLGTNIIGSLVEEGHDVTAVDIRQDVIESISNTYDVMTVVGSGIDCDTLEEAGAATARLIIAMTPKDEVNILCCFLARRMGTHHAVARAEDINYSDRELEFIRKQTNVSMFLRPSQVVAAEMVNRLKLPQGVRAEYFARRSFEMIEVKLKENSVLNGLTLTDMRKKYKGDYLVLAASRGDTAMVPDGNFMLRSGDRIVLGATPKGIDKLLRELGYLAKETRNVMILGGSRTAFFLADQLLEIGVSTKIIEQNRARCRELCELLPEAAIINGDGAKGELLNEEGLKNMDAFISLTGMDEENLLMSIFAAREKVGKTLCKLDRKEFLELADQMNVEGAVNPRQLVTDVVLRYVRALDNTKGSKMETLYHLMDNNVEALEFIVKPDFKFANVTLLELRKKMKNNTLIGGIIRGNKMIIPGGSDSIMEGDRVIVMAANQQIYDLMDIFTEGIR